MKIHSVGRGNPLVHLSNSCLEVVLGWNQKNTRMTMNERLIFQNFVAWEIDFVLSQYPTNSKFSTHIQWFKLIIKKTLSYYHVMSKNLRERNNVALPSHIGFTSSYTLAGCGNERLEKESSECSALGFFRSHDWFGNVSQLFLGTPGSNPKHTILRWHSLIFQDRQLSWFLSIEWQIHLVNS